MRLTVWLVHICSFTAFHSPPLLLNRRLKTHSNLSFAPGPRHHQGVLELPPPHRRLISTHCVQRMSGAHIIRIAQIALCKPTNRPAASKCQGGPEQWYLSTLRCICALRILQDQGGSDIVPPVKTPNLEAAKSCQRLCCPKDQYRLFGHIIQPSDAFSVTLNPKP